MMSKRSLKSAVGAATVMILLASPLDARIRNAEVAEGTQSALARRIVGTWLAELTLRDCVSGVALMEAGRALNTFITGGTVITTPGTNPAFISNGHGVWRHTAGPNFAGTIIAFQFAPGGQVVATATGTRLMELSDDFDELAIADSFVLHDLHGNVIGRTCASGSARRIE